MHEHTNAFVEIIGMKIKSVYLSSSVYIVGEKLYLKFQFVLGSVFSIFSVSELSKNSNDSIFFAQHLLL